MILFPSSSWLTHGMASVAVALVACVGLSATTAAVPKILKVTALGKSLTVTASVPRGWQSVTLESRLASGQGAWVPRSVLRAKVLPPQVTFSLPSTLKGQTLRVRGEAKSSYPLTFFSGKRVFSNRSSTLWRSEPGEGYAYALAGDGNPLVGAVLPGISGTQRSVEESDIWKISGDTLYFFNQYRGLQVIDISAPDAPFISGVLSLPAVGEQMYVLGVRHVALLTRAGNGNEQSRLTVADVSEAAPRVVATLPIEGAILESRMVGTALYVAAQGYLDVTLKGGAEWQWGTALYSFDMADPAVPTVRSTLWFAGQGSAVMATDRYLFVAGKGDAAEAEPVVRVVDISAADGTLREVAGIATAGTVGDKFKMNLSGDVFTVISETFDAANPTGLWRTSLQTFSLADASKPEPLGCLELAPGERLFATRFDGDRAYVVTFQWVDPLWIIDLSEPTRPVVAGSVEVPGWSTYIHPVGGRLVTMGLDGGRMAVSLFDVSDPARASLLDRVPLGEGFSWSEAYANEKALSVLESEGLILVPYEGLDDGGYASRVKLIDVKESSLDERGVIEHRCQPRRTALHRGRVLSLSGKELLSVDIADRDHPAVTAKTELSWAVTQVLTHGDYLLQVETPGFWSAGGQAVLRVAAKAKPDTVLNRVDLGALPVVGACVRDGVLYLLQSPGELFKGGPVIAFGAPGRAQESAALTNRLMTVIDLKELPNVAVLGQAEVAIDAWDAGQYKAVWVAPERLVWVSSGLSSGMCYALVGGGVASRNPATLKVSSIMADVAWWPWWNAGGVRLLTFETGDPTRPVCVSQVHFNPASAWGFSAPRAAQGKIYFSHEQSEYVKVLGKNGRYNEEWRVSEFLDVIDFTDPAVPTVRPSVSIPGQLVGVSQEGSLLYLLGPAMARTGASVESEEAIHACTYDGVNAYLVNSLALPKVWPRPVNVNGGRVFVGRASADEAIKSRIESWALSSAGSFVLQSYGDLERAASALACFEGLLAVQDADSGLGLFDVSSSAVMRPCGSAEPLCGVWADMSRAAGALGDGLWLPLDDFGLLGVPAFSSSVYGLRTR